MFLWKPRVVSHRLLVACVSVVLTVILLNTMLSSSSGSRSSTVHTEGIFHRVPKSSRDVAEQIVPPSAVAPEPVPNNITLNPVLIPGTKISVLSAIERYNYPKSGHHRIMLTGWVARDYRYTDFVCCLRHTAWPKDRPSVQVRAAVYHMADVQQSSPSLRTKPYADAHYSCYVEHDVTTDFNSIFFSTVACSEGASESLKIERPEKPTQPFQPKEGKLKNPSEDKVWGRRRKYFRLRVPTKKPSKKWYQSNGKKAHLKKTLHFQESVNFSNVAVCAGVVNFNFTTKTQAVVEWFEHLWLLGAMRVQLFHYNASEEVLAVLDFYQAEGFLNAIPWNFTAQQIFAGHAPPAGSWVTEKDVSFADCFHRLSGYTLILFTSIYQLIVPKHLETDVPGAAWMFLHRAPKTAVITIATQLLLPIPGQLQVESESEGLGFVSNFSWQAFESNYAYSWLTLPRRVAHVTHREVIPIEDFIIGEFLSTEIEAISSKWVPEPGIQNFTLALATKDNQALDMLRFRVRQRMRCLPPHFSSSDATTISDLLQSCLANDLD